MTKGGVFMSCSFSKCSYNFKETPLSAASSRPHPSARPPPHLWPDCRNTASNADIFARRIQSHPYHQFKPFFSHFHPLPPSPLEVGSALFISRLELLRCDMASWQRQSSRFGRSTCIDSRRHLEEYPERRWRNSGR